MQLVSRGTHPRAGVFLQAPRSGRRAVAVAAVQQDAPQTWATHLQRAASKGAGAVMTGALVASILASGPLNGAAALPGLLLQRVSNSAHG